MIIDPKELHKIEQSLAGLGELIPRMAKNIYDGFIKEGFTEQQALVLTSGYINATITRV